MIQTKMGVSSDGWGVLGALLMIRLMKLSTTQFTPVMMSYCNGIGWFDLSSFCINKSENIR